MKAHLIFFIEIILAIIILLVSIFFLKKKQPLQVNLPRVTHDMPEPIKKVPTLITSQDIKAIAGDDRMTTQLDLARAYIEIGKKKLAKKILDHVTQYGNLNQQQVAKQLMMNL
ncbi:MAG: hypothetical protein K0S27_273 [Gammaproteobacteria bacterium]|jgi:FimV-like protein|nr:hypothetical protein [Gammaproteobacteria bacterium]